MNGGSASSFFSRLAECPAPGANALATEGSWPVTTKDSARDVSDVTRRTKRTRSPTASVGGASGPTANGMVMAGM